MNGLFSNYQDIGKLLTGNSTPNFTSNSFIVCDSTNCFKFNRGQRKCLKRDENGNCILYEDEQQPVSLDEVVVYPYKFETINDIDIKLYISSKGDNLESQYFKKLNNIASNELYLFLEIEDDTNYLGTIRHIIAGGKVRKKLKFRDLKEFVDIYYQIDRKDLKKLFKKGINNTHVALI